MRAPPCPKTVTVTPAAAVAPGDALVATATDRRGQHERVHRDAGLVVSAETAAPEGAGSLFAPSPNPTSGATALRYDVAAAGPVRLAVTDVLGREVAVLADGNAAAGRHEATLDAGRLAPGVYAVRLETGTFVGTQRVVVVR